MSADQATQLLSDLTAIRIVLCLVLGVLLADAMWRR